MEARPPKQLQLEENHQDVIALAAGDGVGAWQKRRLLLALAMVVPGLAHIFLSVFGTARDGFRCADGFADGGGGDNLTYDSVCWSNCSLYEFDRSFWQDSITMQFQLVCQRVAFASAIKLCLFVGFASGTFAAGMISDHLGRSMAISVFSQMLFASGLLATTVTSIYAFAVCWFFVGVSSIGVYTVCIVWAMEVVSAKWRVLVGVLFSFGWPISKLSLTLVAFIFPNWKILFGIFSCLHIFTPILASLFIKESPRWLISKGKYKEASAVLNEMSAENGGRTIEEDDLNQTEIPANKTLFSALLSYPRFFAIHTLAMLVLWFCVGMVSYGISLNWKDLTGKLFLSYACAGVLEATARFVALGVNKWLQLRKLPLIAALMTAFAAIVASELARLGDGKFGWPVLVCFLVAAFCAAFCFCVIWIYSSEIFPTTVRNAGVGASSLAARLAVMAASQLTLLDTPGPMLAAVALVGALTVAVLLPETGRLPLPADVEALQRARSQQANFRWWWPTKQERT